MRVKDLGETRRSGRGPMWAERKFKEEAQGRKFEESVACPQHLVMGWVRSKRKASALRSEVLAGLRGSVLVALGSTLEIVRMEGGTRRARMWPRAWLWRKGEVDSVFFLFA